MKERSWKSEGKRLPVHDPTPTADEQRIPPNNATRKSLSHSPPPRHHHYSIIVIVCFFLLIRFHCISVQASISFISITPPNTTQQNKSPTKGKDRKGKERKQGNGAKSFFFFVSPGTTTSITERLISLFFCFRLIPTRLLSSTFFFFFFSQTRQTGMERGEGEIFGVRVRSGRVGGWDRYFFFFSFSLGEVLLVLVAVVGLRE